MTLKWNDKKFKEDLLKKLEQNAEDVGDFVVSNARNRVLKMRELPQWEKYRRKMVAGGLSYIVTRLENGIEIKVGVKTSDKSKRHGFFIEMGSKKYPANPYLRPAVYENAKKIIALLTGDRNNQG